jgi:ribonucleotide monophosphatase NagD (HAD superfamily)
VLALVPQRIRPLFARFRMPVDSADYVVLGDPRDSCSYPQLNRALRCLMFGAELVAMQKGRYFLTADGPQLDTGGFVALLEYASSKQATIVGKPARHFFTAVIGGDLSKDDRVIVVGDDSRTDIAGAAEMGWQSVLVRTGKYAMQSDEPVSAQPAWEIDSVAELPRLVASLPF